MALVYPGALAVIETVPLLARPSASTSTPVKPDDTVTTKDPEPAVVELEPISSLVGSLLVIVTGKPLAGAADGSAMLMVACKFWPMSAVLIEMPPAVTTGLTVTVAVVSATLGKSFA